MRLQDKVCIVTGGGKGIGAAICKKFADQGAIVAVCDVDEDAVNKLVALINENSAGEAIPVVLDITNKDSIKQLVDDLSKKYGKIDVLVNNAGIIMDAQLHKMSEEQFDKVIDVNLKGTYNCTRAVVDIMREQKSGSIINTSSIVGLYGNFGQTNYAASKFGVIGFVKTWSRELGKFNVRVNAVAPGFVKTTILEAMPSEIISKMEAGVPMKRLGTPEELANAFLFLASDESSYVTGSVLEVSGGKTL